METATITPHRENGVEQYFVMDQRLRKFRETVAGMWGEK